MKKRIAALTIATAALGTSFGLMASPASAGAPCPPSVCHLLERPVVRDTGIKDLLDWVWDNYSPVIVEWDEIPTPSRDLAGNQCVSSVAGAATQPSDSTGTGTVTGAAVRLQRAAKSC